MFVCASLTRHATMLFNSFQFVFFFLAIVPLYYATPHRLRWIPLLAGSYYFYMCWNPAYILLILASTAVDYVVAGRMMKTSAPRGRLLCLLISLTVNLGLLFAFKYYNFFVSSVSEILDSLGIRYHLPESHLLLPVGISFYTFQTLSYTIDVYRGQIQPERHLGKFALYVSFFPQLVAGPIERAGRLLPQFSQRHGLNIDRIMSGLRLMLWGLFKKIVIADRLAEFVNRIYDDPTPHSAATLLLATYFFAFQIYCDFSGYSDIAIGSARVLGFDLMPNFRLPYLARSISDFWRRWHISLTTWFRDYVYIPLGGNRCGGHVAWARNVMLVFLVSGLWHGANWTFVAWGALHGAYFLIGAATRGVRETISQRLRIPTPLATAVGMLLTFHLVVLAWIFFRARNLSDAWLIVCRILFEPFGALYLGPSQLTIALSVALVTLLLTVQALQAAGRLPLYQTNTRARWYVRWPACICLALAIPMLGKSPNDFIYFQF